jgi:hypothetical protein
MEILGYGNLWIHKFRFIAKFGESNYLSRICGSKPPEKYEELLVLDKKILTGFGFTQVPILFDHKSRLVKLILKFDYKKCVAGKLST